MNCAKLMNQVARMGATRYSYWSIMYVAVPAIIFSFVMLTASLMAKDRTISIDSGETYIWGLSSSFLRGDITILSSSALVSVSYYSQIPVRRLSYPATLSGKYWLDPGDHAVYSRYLEIGSVITLNFNSVQGVNFFLFKESENFDQFVAGNHADYLIMKLSMNDVKQRLTFTIKSTDVYYMVFDNVYDEFYSHLDFSITINSIEYSTDNGIAYEEIAPIDCPQCLTELVPAGIKNIFILPETFSSSGYLAFKSTSQKPLTNTTTADSNIQNWSPMKHGMAVMKAGALITIKRKTEGLKGIWIFLFSVICFGYFITLYCYSSIIGRTASVEDDHSENPNASTDRCVHMTHLLEESARKRLLKKGLNAYQQLPEIALSDEDIDYPEGGSKEDSGRGIKSSWGGKEGWISHSKESCEMPHSLLGALSTETQRSHSQYGSDGMTGIPYPQQSWDGEASVGVRSSIAHLEIDIPTTPDAQMTPAKKSVPFARSLPIKSSYVRSFDNTEKQRRTPERPLEGTGPHSVAYLREFYNYFASKSLKSGIKPHSRTPLKGRRMSQYYDDGKNDWRGRRLSAGNSETDEKVEGYSVTSTERRRMSAYKEDYSRRGRIIPASAPVTTLIPVRDDSSAVSLSSAGSDHDEIVRELSVKGFDGSAEEEGENDAASVYSTCDSENSFNPALSNLQRLIPHHPERVEVNANESNSNNDSNKTMSSISVGGDMQEGGMESIRAQLFEEDTTLI